MNFSSDALGDLYRQLAQLAAQYGAERLVLFGSRARGDARYNSDIDLAVYGMPQQNQGTFYWEADELPTLLKFDLVHIHPEMDPAFLANIEKDGIILYGEDQ
jgi:predicted nucleotidyltransferase